MKANRYGLVFIYCENQKQTVVAMLISNEDGSFTFMNQCHNQGVEIVRYSPKNITHFKDGCHIEGYQNHFSVKLNGEKEKTGY